MFLTPKQKLWWSIIGLCGSGFLILGPPYKLHYMLWGVLFYIWHTYHLTRLKEDGWID